MSTDLIHRLGDWLAAEHCRAGVRLVGVNGAQGSGKSTLARALRDRLAQEHSLRVAVLGLDDLYLPKQARAELAVRVHPLLATRGVPGTHDVDLGLQLLSTLPRLQAGQTLRLPHFLKLADDRAAERDWPLVTGPFDLVLFEGWCVGTPPQDEAALSPPANALEAREDADGRWRNWVNARLAGDYQRLFAPLQRLIFLQAPDFDCVYRWRRQQECTDNRREAGTPMNETALRRFIAHYERLTRHALEILPQTADVVAALDDGRRLGSLRIGPR